MIARRIVRIHSKKDLWFFYLFFIFSWEANFIFNDSRMCILKSNKVAWPEYFSKTCTSLETWKNWSRAFNMFFSSKLLLLCSSTCSFGLFLPFLPFLIRVIKYYKHANTIICSKKLILTPAIILFLHFFGLKASHDIYIFSHLLHHE